MQWDDGRIRLMPGDCRRLIASLPDNSVDSVVTDPPYEIGFMNRGFDRTGIAFDVDLWRGILRVLKPGGHVAAFAASRTYHRLACAIEDAGFEIRDQIDWVYASGMPHGSDASLLVDRELGAKRTKVVGHGSAGVEYSDVKGWGSSTANGGKAKSEWDVLAPATEQAEQWSGWYSQLKPAHEPICLARKPLDGNLAHNLLGHGTGALHIDACRVPFRNAADELESKNKNRHADFGSGPRDNHVYGADKADRTDYTAEARFTPNMLFDQTMAEELDSQSGVTVSRKGKPRASAKPGDGWGMTRAPNMTIWAARADSTRCSGTVRRPGRGSGRPWTGSSIRRSNRWSSCDGWCASSPRGTVSYWSRSPVPEPRWRRAGSRTRGAWRRSSTPTTCGLSPAGWKGRRTRSCSDLAPPEAHAHGIRRASRCPRATGPMDTATAE